MWTLLESTSPGEEWFSFLHFSFDLGNLPGSSCTLPLQPEGRALSYVEDFLSTLEGLRAWIFYERGQTAWGGLASVPLSVPGGQLPSALQPLPELRSCISPLGTSIPYPVAQASGGWWLTARLCLRTCPQAGSRLGEARGPGFDSSMFVDLS